MKRFTIATRLANDPASPWKMWDKAYKVVFHSQEEAALEALHQIKQGHLMNSVIAVVPVGTDPNQQEEEWENS